MPSIIYPITRDYRAQWQLPDAFRECIWQEFLDLFQDWTIEQTDGRTIIEGRGAALEQMPARRFPRGFRRQPGANRP
jgi:hypothetical protein